MSTAQPKTFKPATLKGRLESTDKGGVKSTTLNIVTILECDYKLAGMIKYNVFSNRIELDGNLWWGKDSAAINDTDMAYINMYIEAQYQITDRAKIADAIQVVADRHKYNPVTDYLENLKWDGQERIFEALNYFFGAEICEYNTDALRLFMLAAIERQYHPGAKWDAMLCLVGGQGVGKSTFFRFLAIKDEWFTDDLKKLDDPNVYRQFSNAWIVEMSEMLAVYDAKSVELIKSFLSRSQDTYKIPYQIHPRVYKRCCVFGGSTNNVDFLPKDRSGNRRFLPIELSNQGKVHILEDEQKSRDYINQMWAEAMVYYENNKPISLKFTPAMNQYLADNLNNYAQEDSNEGLIIAYLESVSHDFVCCIEIYQRALLKGSDAVPAQWESRMINQVISNSGLPWERVNSARKTREYGKQKGWQRVKHVELLDVKPIPDDVKALLDNHTYKELG